MATATIEGIRIAGVSASVPEDYRTVADEGRVFGEGDAERIASSIGVTKRHVSAETLCTSDLCQDAAAGLMAALGWEPETITALVFVSQTPDYLLPATSCALHGRLGLAKHCAALDINLGCSGYIYGLLVASQLASATQGRTLLLCGDTISRIVSPQDRATAPLFGDAGTATALEPDDAAQAMHFVLGTDGTGTDALKVPAGGFRRPADVASAERTLRENGNVRSDEDLYMDGAEIFTFTLREVPPLIASVLGAAHWDIGTPDGYVFHQANRFMLQHLAKRMRLPADKVVIDLEEFGNTSSASIPLALVHAMGSGLQGEENRLVLAGFGVGFSWGAAAVTTGPMVIPPLRHLRAADVA